MPSSVSSCFHIHVCNIYLIDKPLCKPSFLAEIAECVLFEPVHEISNNVECATSKASDQPAHT